MGPFWRRFGIVLGSFWDSFGVVLGSFWGRFGIVLGSFWDRFDVVLEPFFDMGFDWCVVSPAAVLHIGVLTASGASPPFFTRGDDWSAMHRRHFLLVMGVRRRCGDDMET